jgi:hypothetical protein
MFTGRRVICNLCMLCKRHPAHGSPPWGVRVYGQAEWITWKPPSSPVYFPLGKLMATVFLDKHGVILVDFFPSSATTTAGCYQGTVTLAVCHKRPGLPWKRVLLLHNNAQPHTHCSQHSDTSWATGTGRFLPILLTVVISTIRLPPVPRNDEAPLEVSNWWKHQGSQVMAVCAGHIILHHRVDSFIHCYDTCLKRYGNCLQK